MGSLKTFIGLCVYRVAPIKRNRFVFTSYSGHYSDNTRYVSEKMHELYPDAEIVWLVQPNYAKYVPEYAKIVNHDSLLAWWYRGTARAQLDNVYGFRAQTLRSNSLLSKFKIKLYTLISDKKAQPVFASMHCTPLKKLGRSQIGNIIYDFKCPNTFLLVGDDYTKKILDYVTFYQCKMGVVGAPRNDILFKHKNDELREKLGLPKERKLILFAPTFRNDGMDVADKNVMKSGISQLDQMRFDELFDTLHKKFGGDWSMVLRFHYHVADMVDWDKLEREFPGRFINGNLHDEMAEYLSCADLLLTDASSSMFDIAHVNKPCFLFFPDLDNYKNKERGFYYDIEALPFPLAESFDELLTRIDEFDSNEYAERVRTILSEIGTMSDGNASERFVRFVLKECGIW